LGSVVLDIPCFLLGVYMDWNRPNPLNPI
jgi:hypothetical protein